MNSDNPRNCQRNVDNKNDQLSVGIVERGDSSYALSGADMAIMEELDSIVAEFVATPATPADAIDRLPPEYAVALADFDIDDPHDADVAESAAVRAARAKLASPEAQALLLANKAHGHTRQAMDAIDSYRKTPEGRASHNAAQRAKYAEGRDVRDYRRHATEEDRIFARRQDKKAEQKDRRKKMTPEQKKAENEKRSARRREAKAKAMAASETAMKADPDFGSF